MVGSEIEPASAWQRLEKRFERYNWIHAYPNIAAVLFALWYGEGDFTKSMSLLAQAGNDVDCNAGLVGNVLGIMHSVPSQWAHPLGDLLETYIKGKERLSIRELAERTARLAKDSWPADSGDTHFMGSFPRIPAMKYDPLVHHRRSIRLKEYDYTQPGAYFVTLVTQHHEHLFGEIMDGEIRINELGEIVADTWQWLASQYPFIELGTSVVMPNHFHGIVIINSIDPRRGGSRPAPTGKMTISELGITYCDPPIHRLWFFQHLIVLADNPEQQAVAG